uniref:Uncharacterized protein n=1 Tax=Laurenciella marilzae TaxID=1413812 RepID=A0A1Z1M1C8_9FLOR|nr:hypothetical protein [Laurenciella marilzae]ARW59888.1 hypothetical protein [Laurenciella marilzae]
MTNINTYNLCINFISLGIFYIYKKKYNIAIHKYFLKMVRDVYKLHKKINYYQLDKMANLILKSYVIYKKSYKLKQYIRKFNYLYLKNDKYYNKYKYLDHISKIEVNKIAITNLYLITKLIGKQGIYTLIKYLIH